MPDLQLLTELLALAATLSGYPPIPVRDVPPIRWLTPAEMTREICPDQPKDCAHIVAQFDAASPRIRLSTSLSLEFSHDRSFLVHELVHVLQYHANGREMPTDCPSSLRFEREAYGAQNAYLRQLGVAGRHGAMIANMKCAADQNDDSGLRLERPR